MRERLLEYLVAELGPYVKFRASDPMALYIHVPKPPLAYPELEGNQRRIETFGLRRFDTRVLKLSH